MDEQGHKEEEKDITFKVKNTKESSDADFTMSNYTKVKALKEKYMDHTGKEGQFTVRLMFQGKELRDDQDLVFYKIKDETHILAVYREI